MSKKPKVTECWAEVKDGKPDSFEVYTEQNIYSCPAILIWREDYDALKLELESERRWAEHYFREWDKAKKELEDARSMVSEVQKQNLYLMKELDELRENRTISLETMGWSKEPTTEAHGDEEAK